MISYPVIDCFSDSLFRDHIRRVLQNRRSSLALVRKKLFFLEKRLQHQIELETAMYSAKARFFVASEQRSARIES